MKRIIFCGIILSSILILALAPGCSKFASVTGTGNVTSKQYSFANFTDIEVGNAFEVLVAPLNTYSVSISAYENLLDYVNISQSGSTLKIGLKPISYVNANFKATITMPTLNSLNLSGASHGNAAGFKSAQDFTLTGSGASFITLDIEAGNTALNLSGVSSVSGQLKCSELKFELSGASLADLSGSADNLTLIESGDSRTNLTNFAAQNANASLSGASTANILVNGNLDVNLTGGSSLNYLGTPTLGRVTMSGGSQLNGKEQ